MGGGGGEGERVRVSNPSINTTQGTHYESGDEEERWQGKGLNGGAQGKGALGTHGRGQTLVSQTLKGMLRMSTIVLGKEFLLQHKTMSMVYTVTYTCMWQHILP